MAMATISLEVDVETARAFSAASTEDRRKLQLLLGLRLRELTAGRVRPLKEIMDEIGAQAEARGLTPEILESLLRGIALVTPQAFLAGIQGSGPQPRPGG
jgi:hypothetical protein